MGLKMFAREDRKFGKVSYKKFSPYHFGILRDFHARGGHGGISIKYYFVHLCLN